MRFSRHLKFAEVSTLFKKKDILNKVNYRPVSILVALSKIYEKAVGVPLTGYFNSIFSSLLSAFRKGYSCQSSLLNMIEKFKSALDKGEFVACISMDISKAFDCLPHCLTICKLFSYGLSREACTLQRKQRVKIDNVISEWGEIGKGVPQGSILGLLIFNIFVNDLCHFVKQGSMYNYADDNSVSVSHRELNSLTRQVQTEAEVTIQWFSDNAMETNPAKLQGLLLKGNKQASDFRVLTQGQQSKFSKSIPTLGICIDEKLTFDEHVNNICLKASRQISALQRLTGLLDMPSRKAIYNSCIVSNFNYCPLVYYFTSRESINKMQKIQERALRFVLKDSVSDYDTLLTKFGIDSFRISSLRSMAVEIYKILNDMSPEYLSVLSKSSIPYSLRNNSELIQQKMRTTTFGIKSFSYYGAHLWNSLPVDIKSAVTLGNFKTLVKNWQGPSCHCSVCQLII